MVHNETLDVIPLNDYKKVCNSCTIYIVLFAVFLLTCICISIVFIYFQWYLKKRNVQWYFKKIMFVLSLILVLKQKSIECNSTEHINHQY